MIDSGSWLKSLRIPLLLCTVICLVSIPDLLGWVNWQPYALRPRVWPQWYGVFTAPLLHGSWEHLWSNLPPFFVLSAGILFFYPNISLPVLTVSYLAPGIWTFLAARDSLHLGASGVVYAFAFFLFFSGVFRRDIPSLVLTMIVSMFYGSMVWGVFPVQPGVSWESHAFGALAGILLAWYYRKRGKKPPSYPWQSEDYPEETGPWDYQRWYSPPKGFQHPGHSE